MEVAKNANSAWVVLESIENQEGTRCVDIFIRADNSYGFEEFRFDPEDGHWTQVRYYSSHSFDSREEAYGAAQNVAPWLS